MYLLTIVPVTGTFLKIIDIKTCDKLIKPESPENSALLVVVSFIRDIKDKTMDNKLINIPNYPLLEISP